MHRADEQLLAQARARLSTPLSGRDGRTSVALGSALLAAAVAMAAFLPGHRPFSVVPAALLIVCYAVVSRVEFELGPGSVVPTQLVLVPMLFVLPVSAVPLCVAAGYVLSALIDHAVGKRHAQRAFVLLTYSWHSVGPALVLSLFGNDELRWTDSPLYVAALAAQFALDFVSSTAREHLAFGVSPRKLVPYLAWVYAVDSLLAPAALLIAWASAYTPFAFLVALPVVALLALLAHDRRRQVDRALELSQAYEGARRDARTDPLTGLGNRLAWDEEIERAEAEATTGSVAAIVVDLDGLKLANDTGGHELGDRLLRSLADVVAASVGAGDLVARIGGDEFGILMADTDPERCADVAARIRMAIKHHPAIDGFPLSAAVGDGFGRGAEAVANADLQMYFEKRSRPPKLFEVGGVALLRPLADRAGADDGQDQAASAANQVCEVLLRVIRERDEGLGQHVHGVAALAVTVGGRLGLSAADLDDLGWAAKLHDVGKVGVPDAVLHKRGRLAPQEQVLMHAHPLIGARILAGAPGLVRAAKLVRASHERYDGDGYPDRLAGEEIPLGARILSVSDAYDAMTSERPYQRARTHEEALAELAACAGTQFDPVVVTAFEEMMAEKARFRLRSVSAERARSFRLGRMSA